MGSSQYPQRYPRFNPMSSYKAMYHQSNTTPFAIIAL
jgi:hypothetical protein